MPHANLRPRRSVLYMPGSNARALEKAASLNSDGLILDLEDAVAPDAKAMARTQVCAAVAARGFGRREVVIRVNGLETPWFADDIRAAVAAGPDAILVPKIASPQDLAFVHGLLSDCGAPASLALWAMMETPRAIFRALEIATSGGRLACLVMGTNDLVKEVHGLHTPGREAVMTALGLSVLAARAGGLAILDGVYNDIDDAAGFEAVCAQGRAMGFDGKTLIHPSQLETCNRVFAPSPQEVAAATKILAAFALPENHGRGAISLDGRMVERLHAEIASRTVALANAIAAQQ
ncbi:MAG TPA: CoA ester lyase [Alphaproteobacteria bacterium]|nr:CoA ester lyase [Alphaproteobacteria bacterium]HAJ46528.1 CoA ester lyase [Alphaproteobacteria bacterium]